MMKSYKFQQTSSILLSVIQVNLILLTIALSLRKIFISKTFYCLWVLYFFLLILINFSLYSEYTSITIFYDDHMKELAIKMQALLIIYIFIVNTVLMDLIPLKRLKSKKFNKFGHLSHKDQAAKFERTQKSWGQNNKSESRLWAKIMKVLQDSPDTIITPKAKKKQKGQDEFDRKILIKERLNQYLRSKQVSFLKNYIKFLDKYLQFFNVLQNLKKLKFYSYKLTTIYNIQQKNRKNSLTSNLKKMQTQNSIPIVTLILVTLIKCQSNLVCDSGFQRDVLPYSSTNTYQNIVSRYAEISNNYSCWYAPGKTRYEVKQFLILGKKVRVLDFIAGQPYTICQNISLALNHSYQLKFSFIIDGAHEHSNLTFNLNNKTTYTVKSTSTVVPVQGTYTFLASQLTNILCFSTSTKFKSHIPHNDKFFYGPVINNITLIEITSQQANTSNQATTNTTNQPAPMNNNTEANSSNFTNTQQNPVQNIPDNSTPTTLPPPQTSQTSQTSQIVIVNLTTHWNPYTGILYLYSDWKMDDKIPFQFFQLTLVEINGQIQRKTAYRVDINGYMFMETLPDVVYMSQNINHIRVHIPQDFIDFFKVISVVFVVDGNSLEVDSLSQDQQRILDYVQPYIDEVTTAVKKIFVYLNMFYCSFFILGIIQFWNLTLLYNFLTIKCVPQFAQAFFSKMINFFFTFNSLTTQINRIANKANKTQSLIDFRFMTENEKMLIVKNNHVWFSFVGLSSNFLSNNLDCLVLLSIFLIKSFLFRLILKAIKKNCDNLKQIRIQVFLRQFSRQLLCFTPFIITSALSVFMYLGQTNFYGIINNILHLSLVFLAIILPSLALTRILSSKRSHKRNHKTNRKFKNRFEKVIQILFNTLIPTLVFINHNISFFILTSFLILWKLINFWKNFKTFSRTEKLTKIFINFCWLVYHLCFLAFYVMDCIQFRDSELGKRIIKYAALVAIFAILVGGLFDLLECLLSICKTLKKVFVFIAKKCRKDPLPNSPKKIKQKIKGDQSFSIRNDCDIPKPPEARSSYNLNKTQEQIDPIILKKINQKKLTNLPFQQKFNKKGKIDRRFKRAKKQIHRASQFVLIPVEVVDRPNRIRVKVKERQIKKRSKMANIFSQY